MNSFEIIISTIFFLVFTHGLILGIILLSKKKFPQLFLSLIIFLFSFLILLHNLSYYIKNQYFINYHSTVILLCLMNLGTFFYFYIKSILENNYKLKLKDILHFLLFIICTFIIFPISVILNNEYFLNLTCDLFFILIIINNLFYIFISCYKIFSFKKNLKKNFSYDKKINLNWIIILLANLISFMIISIIFSFIYSNSEFGINLVLLFTSIILFLIGYFGLFQPEIFNKNNEEFITNKKYQKSILTKEQEIKYTELLEKNMNTNKTYLNSELTLPLLAKELGISIHHLSQIINDNYKVNFYDFINSKRIQEAKILLINKEYKNINIASIGFEVGFNSLSSFNSAFKKFTNTTPSQFRNTNL